MTKTQAVLTHLESEGSITSWEAIKEYGATQYKTCFTKDMKFTPIHDLSSELLDKIYAKYNIEIPNVYKYVSRTGCMGCPYGSYKGETEKELNLINETQFKFVTSYFKESYDVLGIKPYRQISIFDTE